MFTVNRLPVRLLFVSQNRDICDIYRYVFERFGCVVAVAYSGKEAVEIAETHQPHAAYMSLELGDMRGKDLGIKLRRLDATRDVVLVAVTGHAHRTIAVDGLDAGFDYCITVPVSFPQLIFPLARIPNINASAAVSAVLQEAQPTLESQAYTAFRNTLLGRK